MAVLGLSQQSRVGRLLGNQPKPNETLLSTLMKKEKKKFEEKRKIDLNFILNENKFKFYKLILYIYLNSSYLLISII